MYLGKKLRLAVASVAAVTLCGPIYANDQNIEEVLVTARRQAEGLQDVPVTIAALTEADLERYNITTLTDAAKMIPNMVIAQGGSGNGASLRLRGIGSSTISAAFDHSVAINLDGVVVNRGRFIHNSYLDMGQLEVLKGPQSLYFGKSATAGVVSITTNDPGDEFELELSGGIETEYEGTFAEVVVSGPLTETFGARLAVGFTEQEELFENYSFRNDPVNVAVNGAEEFYGDESLNMRLTLVWEPSDTFSAKLKYNYSDYDNNGSGTAWAEEVCPEGGHQPTGVPSGASPFAVFQGVDDCKINGNTSKVNLNPGLRSGLPNGYDDGKPGLQQETNFTSLKLDWDITEQISLSAITGIVELDHKELDDYSYGAGVFGGYAENVYESWSQEIQISTDFDSPVNFVGGFLYQEIEQEFDAYQYAFNLGVLPNIFGAAYGSVGGDPTALIIGPDPTTGNEFDYRKTHFLETEALSFFAAMYWDISDRAELTIGARYTDETKDGRIEIPYLHAAAALFGFGGPPVIDEGLEFEDDNISPEVSLNYHVTDDISAYVSYKEGFKSGGIDNSALPTAALNPLSPTFDGFGFLIYESEVAKGFEGGVKANLLDGAMRFNASAFSYEYSDLQVQLFDSTIIQFQTFNASALETQGVEFDMLWYTNVEGLTVRSAWAYTDTKYSEDFVNATGENLKGQDGAGSADITGFLGATFDTQLGSSAWRMSLSADARFTGDYAWTPTVDPFMQDSFWIYDAAISVYSEDSRHQFNLIGRNVGDEIYISGGGAIPGRIPMDNTSANSLDQAATTNQGRTISLQYRFSL